MKIVNIKEHMALLLGKLIIENEEMRFGLQAAAEESKKLREEIATLKSAGKGADIPERREAESNGVAAH